MSLFAFQFYYILFFFRLGHDLGRRLGPNLVGLNGARGPDGVGLAPGKKTHLINELGSGRGS